MTAGPGEAIGAGNNEQKHRDGQCRDPQNRQRQHQRREAPAESGPRTRLLFRELKVSFGTWRRQGAEQARQGGIVAQRLAAVRASLSVVKRREAFGLNETAAGELAQRLVREVRLGI